MKAQRVLVTGASGLLGATALFELVTRYELHGVYNRHPIMLPGVRTEGIDLTDEGGLSSYCERVAPDWIFHAAALTDVDACEANRSDAYRINVGATRALARYAADRGAKLVLISTDAFFNGSERQVFTEEDAPNPVNYYGETKALAERAVQEVCRDYLVVRTNIYGWNYQNKLSLAEWMHANLSAGKTIPLVKDVFYTPILTNTLVDCVRRLVDKDARGIFNVASDRVISKLEFGQLLCDVFKLDPRGIEPRSIRDLSLRAPRSNNMALSVDKLKRALVEVDLRVERDLAKFAAQYQSGYVEQLRACALRS